MSQLLRVLGETFQNVHNLLNNSLSSHQESKTKKITLEEPISIESLQNNSSSQRNKDKLLKKKRKEKNQQNQQNQCQLKKQKKIKKKKKQAKWEAEGRPRPPINSFMLFLKASKSEIMVARPDLIPSQISSFASDLWSQLPEEEKEKYNKQYFENKQKYDQEMEEFYKANPQLQASQSKKRKSKSRIKRKSQQIVHIESDNSNEI